MSLESDCDKRAEFVIPFFSCSRSLALKSLLKDHQTTPFFIQNYSGLKSKTSESVNFIEKNRTLAAILSSVVVNWKCRRYSPSKVKFWKKKLETFLSKFYYYLSNFIRHFKYYQGRL